MIIYDNNRWIHVVLTWGGSVWPNIRGPFVLWCCFVVASFSLSNWLRSDLGEEGHTILGTTMSFLLIFRANQAYARYWEGRSNVSIFFSALRDFIMMSTLYLHGGVATVTWASGRHRHKATGGTSGAMARGDEMDAKARELRVNIVRLTVALAVMLKTNTRIAHDGYCFGGIGAETKWLVDWDRLRLRQLLQEDEWQLADQCLGIEDSGGDDSTEGLARQFRGRCSAGPPESWPESFGVNLRPAARMHSTVVYYLRELLFMNMNDYMNSVPWGIKERFIPGLSKLLGSSQGAFETINQIITTPLPLPYACLCKTLLSIWMAMFPFVVDYKLGYFGGVVVPILIALALLGIDAISTELENPFGDDANDLDLLEAIHNLETEAMEMLALCGDVQAHGQFVWRRIPTFVSESSCKPVLQHLALAELAADEVAPAHGEATPRGHGHGRGHGASHRGGGGAGGLIRSASASEASSGE